MYRFFFFFIVFSSSSFFAFASVMLQKQVSLPVYNENAVQAREEAIFLAKQELLLSVLHQYLAPSIQELAEPLFSSLLDRPDVAIEEFRILQESWNREESSFLLTLEGRVLQAPLLSFLRRHHLPLSSSPPKSIPLLYHHDHPFWDERNPADFFKELAESWNAYAIHFNPTVVSS